MDWQSYLDGEMDAAEKTALEARLAREPQLQKELDGYKAFAAEIKRQGSAVSIPSHRLHEAMDSVVSSRPSGVRWWLRPSLAMATVLLLFFAAWALMRGPSSSIAKTPVRESISQPTPSHASNWLTEKTGLKIPPIELKNPQVKVVAARYGEGWGSIEYLVAGEKLTLFMANRKALGKGKSPLLYVNEEGTSWQAHGLAYYLEGPRRIRDLIIEELIEATRSKKVAAASEPC